ncbi:MAG TPA: 4-alpha-glucanotransferase, partial [Pirellulales bacterium]|nr:4-alpha-glucanotransferase [Pirellulales bacterium]
MTTDPWGIDDGYEDVHGRLHETSSETRDAILAAMGADQERPPAADDAVRVVRPGQAASLGAGELTLEDGTRVEIADRAPADLPPGYHRFRPRGSEKETLLIASPCECRLPLHPLWGWAVQLYAARSADSWGIGDFADLRRLAEWSRTLGAGMLLVNPLHATSPVDPRQASPYYPSSRRFRNPLYLRVEEAPGASQAGLDLESPAAAGRALNFERYIDRSAAFELKRQALETIWDRFSGDVEFHRYCAEQGRALEEFAAFCCLAERHGGDWRQWPAEWRRADKSAIRRAAEQQPGRFAYHQWVQWLLDEQLARAAKAAPFVQDLPIGIDPGGADAWVWQDELAAGCSVGAPPDMFNTLGQDWGLPPFIPHKLRQAGYRPFVETIRATLRHAGGLRIDHVMGLFRLYWIPQGMGAQHGAFVRYRPEELLAIVALESQRAEAFVVGEDLGTVEPGVRERMAEHGLLSYRVLWMEEGPPQEYPELAMVAVTTHDLPTIAGLESGRDLAAQKSLRLKPNEEATQKLRQRL